MLWYQQPPGDTALNLVGYVDYMSIYYEESYKNHFNITGDLSGNTAKNGSLFIVDLKQSEHSAVYYCAARYARRLRFPVNFTKTKRLLSDVVSACRLLSASHGVYITSSCLKHNPVTTSFISDL